MREDRRAEEPSGAELARQVCHRLRDALPDPEDLPRVVAQVREAEADQPIPDAQRGEPIPDRESNAPSARADAARSFSHVSVSVSPPTPPMTSARSSARAHGSDGRNGGASFVTVGAKASAATFVAVQATCWTWGYFTSPPGRDPLLWNLWHAANAVLAAAGLGTAAWSIAASHRRRLVLLLVVPLLVMGEAYLLRWEWVLYIWRTRGFAP